MSRFHIRVHAAGSDRVVVEATLDVSANLTMCKIEGGLNSGHRQSS